MNKIKFNPKLFLLTAFHFFSIPKHSFSSPSRRNQGFSLIEILISIGIIGILAMILVPRTQVWVNQYRLNGAARLVWADLNNARMTAIKENQTITVTFHPDTKTSYTFSRGGTIFFTRNLTHDYPDVTVVKATNNILRFFSTGLANEISTITVQGVDKSKTVTTLLTGRIQTT